MDPDLMKVPLLSRGLLHGQLMVCLEAGRLRLDEVLQDSDDVVAHVNLTREDLLLLRAVYSGHPLHVAHFLAGLASQGVQVLL